MPTRLMKTRRMRGSRTQGYGRVSQHRKSGGRGGKGKAGGHKTFWIQTVKYNPNRFRRIGFKPPSSLEPSPTAINVGELEDLALQTFGAGALKSGAERLELDLSKLGWQKLLGRGKIGIPLRIKVSSYTSRALEKVKTAGGEIESE